MILDFIIKYWKRLFFILIALILIYVNIHEGVMDRRERKFLNYLKLIEPSEIEKIEVYDNISDRTVKKIIREYDRLIDITKFANYTNDIQIWKPNHPTIKRTYMIRIIVDSEYYDLEVHIVEGIEETLCIYFWNEKIYARFKSKMLFTWLKEEDVISEKFW